MKKKTVGSIAKSVYKDLKKNAPKGSKVKGPGGVGNYTVGKTKKKEALSKIRAGLKSTIKI